MNIDRRHLVLPALAVGLLGIVPTFAASADEDAVAKRIEARKITHCRGRSSPGDVADEVRAYDQSKTAKTLRLKIPATLLVLADGVIE